MGKIRQIRETFPSSKFPDIRYTEVSLDSRSGAYILEIINAPSEGAYAKIFGVSIRLVYSHCFYGALFRSAACRNEFHRHWGECTLHANCSVVHV